MLQGLSSRASDEPRLKQGGQGRGGRGGSGGYSSNFPGTISPPFRGLTLGFVINLLVSSIYGVSFPQMVTWKPSFPCLLKEQYFWNAIFFKDIITWWSFPSITFLLSFFIWILRIMLLFCCLMSPITFLLNPACHDKVPFRCHYLSFDVVLVFFFIDYFYKMNCFSAETCPKHHQISY